jgi:hypothetical protein
MTKPTNTDLARAARADRIIKKLRRYYALGQEAEAYRTKHEDRHALTSFARRKGMTNCTLRSARQFAEYYSPAELDELCQLRKPAPDGLPLNWAYVLQLMRIPDAKSRKRLQKQAVDKGWTGPELGAVIGERLAAATDKKLAGKSRHGGRRFKQPGSPEALLGQLIMEAEFWNRRFERAWTVNGHLDLSGLTGQAGKQAAAELPARLRRARVALSQVQSTAGKAVEDLLKLERRLKRAKS